MSNAIPAHLLACTTRVTLERHFEVEASQIDELAERLDLDGQVPALLLEQGGRGLRTGGPRVAFENAMLEWNKAINFLARAKPENAERLAAKATACRDGVVAALRATGCPSRA